MCCDQFFLFHWGTLVLLSCPAILKCSGLSLPGNVPLISSWFHCLWFTPNNGFSIFLLSIVSRGLSVIHQGPSAEGTLPLSLARYQFSSAVLFCFNLHTLLCWKSPWRMDLMMVLDWFCWHYTITKNSVFCEIIPAFKKLYRLAHPTHHPHSQLQHNIWKQIWSPPIPSRV